MPDTLAPLSDLDHQITAALADLRDARAAYAYSPNADSKRTRDYAELRLNRLLDRRHATRR